METVDLGKGIILPIDIVNRYNNSANRKLCMLYQMGSNINSIELGINYKDMKLLSTVLKDNTYEGYNFIIIDSNEIVYDNGNFSVRVCIDERGYFYIGENYVVHSHEYGYITGKNVRELNKNYLEEVRLGIYPCSNSFSISGFINPVSIKRKIR